ncbi:serine protease [Streptomyces sp. MBT53]|uniref:S1 family peptidase n=1 Tax=Streptomyces sp. MBT53 TaxID=1488384 RepID=UPI0019144C76|nr:serine protease [Streptomyces sp. MBT53]MBK6015457.1 trypsin-like peptidase domain-containing protein [Streptomyces sp. MBT53]
MDIQRRVVEVLADCGLGARPRWRSASGFLIDGRHVLTSGHAAVEGELTVRRPGGAPGAPKEEWPAERLLVGDLTRADLAILTLGQDVEPLPRIGYAQVARHSPQPAVVEACSAIGFPRFMEHGRAGEMVRDTAQVEGRIPTSQNLISGLLTLRTTHTPLPLPATHTGLAESPWSGMSGAAVLADGRVLGVVSEHAPRQGASDLTIVPVNLIATLTDAASWWRILGVEPAHLPILPGPAAAGAGPGTGRAIRLKVRDTRARRLGVHAAIQAPGTPDELPPYVPRTFDSELREAIRRGKTEGCFVLLLGGSSVGKTRSLYEAAQAELKDWWLVFPDRTDLRVLWELVDLPGQETIVWLDDIQRYLGEASELTPNLVRALLQTGAVILGTIWPEDYDRHVPSIFHAREVRSKDTELLGLAHRISVSGTLDESENEQAREAAQFDPRIRLALSTPDNGMTQLLAAGPQLLNSWLQAPSPYAKYVITAAVDARRLGVEGPLPKEFLAETVPSYLSAHEKAKAPHDWLEQALAFASKPTHGATSALAPHGSKMSVIDGYRAADFLVQHAAHAQDGRLPVLSMPLWDALARHTIAAGDRAWLASNAEYRGFYRIAVALTRPAAETDQRAYEVLARCLASKGRLDEVKALCLPRAEAGEAYAMDALSMAHQIRGQDRESSKWRERAQEAGGSHFYGLRQHMREDIQDVMWLLDDPDVYDEYFGGQAPDSEPNDPYTIIVLASKLQDERRFAEAERHLRRGISLGTGRGLALYTCLRWHFQRTGQKKELKRLERYGLEPDGTTSSNWFE